MARIVWGTVNANGSPASGEGFEVTKTASGQYNISFDPPFSGLPSIVGSQTRFGALNQNTSDNIVFPFLSNAQATALTGDNSGDHRDRNFSFIAVGP
jgi:hypothetical protein